MCRLKTEDAGYKPDIDLRNGKVFQQDFIDCNDFQSRILNKFNLIIYSRFITCIHPVAHERKPTTVYFKI